MIGNYAYKDTKIISKEQLKLHNTTNVNDIMKNGDYFVIGNEVGGISCWFKNNQQIQIGSEWLIKTEWNGLRITNIYGIK